MIRHHKYASALSFSARLPPKPIPARHINRSSMFRRTKSRIGLTGRRIDNESYMPWKTRIDLNWQ